MLGTVDRTKAVPYLIASISESFLGLLKAKHEVISGHVFYIRGDNIKVPSI